mmetsp:Transcript_43988/g.73258  ORF Transcript_43988/g.73258 Transcript_43988/m.73258 type:complete len:237 (+) Transcript_43988:825-1535(+)
MAGKAHLASDARSSWAHLFTAFSACLPTLALAGPPICLRVLPVARSVERPTISFPSWATRASTSSSPGSGPARCGPPTWASWPRWQGSGIGPRWPARPRWPSYTACPIWASTCGWCCTRGCSTRTRTFRTTLPMSGTSSRARCALWTDPTAPSSISSTTASAAPTWRTTSTPRSLTTTHGKRPLPSRRRSRSTTCTTPRRSSPPCGEWPPSASPSRRTATATCSRTKRQKHVRNLG